MKETLITLKTAVLANEKGFYEYNSCESCYHNNELKRWCSITGFYEDYILAPTQSLLQKYLREKHNIFVFINNGYNPYLSCDTIIFEYQIFYITKRKENQFVGDNCHHLDSQKRDYNTYEEALEAGLYQGLLLIKKL